MPESSIGNYTIIRDIGEGGMARIYLASHRDVPSLRVILKVVSDPQLAERFRREAEKLAQLDGHPGICKIKHFFNHGRDFVIAMEFIDGHTLEELIQRDGPLPVADTLAIIDAVLDVLVFAHKRGIYHRDIKPSNVMIDSDNRVKVIDFGIAKGEADPTLTAVNAYLGTPSYMAPEQFRSSEDINYASADIYSIGTTLYQMLTGELPYKETDLFLLRDAKMFSKPTRPRKLRSDIPKSVEEIIVTAMEREPEDRYPSVELMRQAVQADKSFPGGARGSAPKIKKRRSKGAIVTAVVMLILLALASTMLIPDVRERVLATFQTAESATSPARIPSATSPTVTLEATSPNYGATFSSADPIVLQWNDAPSTDDPSYRLVVARDGRLRDIILTEVVEQNSFTLPVNPGAGTFFWQVGRSINNDTDTLLSSIMTFRILDSATPTGRVDIVANLPVDISIDGNPAGRGTTELSRTLDTGMHVVRVSNDATQEREIIDTLFITTDTALSRSYNLNWAPVQVTVRGRPESVTVAINGGGRQELPVTVRLAPGTHAFELRHPQSDLSEDSTVRILPGRDTVIVIDLSGQIVAQRIEALRDSISALDGLVSASERREAAYLQIVDWRSQIPTLLDTRQDDSARLVLENAVTRYNDILQHRDERRTAARTAVTSFMDAFAEKDLAAMESLYPAMPAEEKQSWATFFKAAEGLHVDWSIEQFQPTGATATADVSLTMSFTDRSGNRTETVPWQLKLAEQNDRWIVTTRDAR